MLSQSNFLKIFNDEISHFDQYFEASNVLSAANYALNGAGKRFRPLLIHSLVDESVKQDDLVQAALALELIHTYSLIHDDLPALDNDDYRRGRLTTHKVYSEAIAILAGDALLTHAFSMLLKLSIEDYKKLMMIEYLTQAAGLNGMILGQDLDLQNNQNNAMNKSQIRKLYELKTGALFGCALIFASILKNQIDHLDEQYEIGLKLGFLFQIQDDYLEKYGDPDLLGKSTTSDLENNKKTWIQGMRKEEVESYLLEGFQEIKRDIIKSHTAHAEFILLIDSMIQRRY